MGKQLPTKSEMCGLADLTVFYMGRYTVSGSGADCKSVVNDSGGSTPSLPTKSRNTLQNRISFAVNIGGVRLHQSFQMDHKILVSGKHENCSYGWRFLVRFKLNKVAACRLWWNDISRAELIRIRCSIWRSLCVNKVEEFPFTSLIEKWAVILVLWS